MDTIKRGISISAMAPTRSWIVGIPAYPASPRRLESTRAAETTGPIGPAVDGRPSAWAAACECPDICELDHQLD